MLLEDEYAFIPECGFLKPGSMCTHQDIPTIIQSLCTEYLNLRSSHEMAQFLEGFDCLKMAALLSISPKAMKPLFVHNTQEVSTQVILRLCKPLLSPLGCNSRDEEEAVFLNWTDYMQGNDCAICMHVNTVGALIMRRPKNNYFPSAPQH